MPISYARGHGKETTVRRLVLANLKSLILLVCLAAGLTVLAAGRHARAKPPKDATYIGQKKCRICHFRQFLKWKKSKHAKTWETLEAKDKTRPECIVCHVTGYKEPSGYVSEEKTPHLTGVHCEACHGPGSAHAEAAKDAPKVWKGDKKMNKVPLNSCVACHNPHVLQKDRVAKLRAEGKSGG